MAIEKDDPFIAKNAPNKCIQMDFYNANPARPFSLHMRAIP